MTTKCYIADYDHKIMRLKSMLQKYDRDPYLQIIDDTKQNERNEEAVKENVYLKYYLQNINNHLDEILNQPGISDEELQNLEKDHKEILKMINKISKDVNTANKHICSHSQPCNKPNNINIHINSREIGNASHSFDSDL